MITEGLLELVVAVTAFSKVGVADGRGERHQVATMFAATGSCNGAGDEYAVVALTCCWKQCKKDWAMKLMPMILWMVVDSDDSAKRGHKPLSSMCVDDTKMIGGHRMHVPVRV